MSVVCSLQDQGSHVFVRHDRGPCGMPEVFLEIMLGVVHKLRHFHILTPPPKSVTLYLDGRFSLKNVR